MISPTLKTVVGDTDGSKMRFLSPILKSLNALIYSSKVIVICQHIFEVWTPWPSCCCPLQGLCPPASPHDVLEAWETKSKVCGFLRTSRLQRLNTDTTTHPYLQHLLSGPAFSQQRVHVLNTRCGGEEKGQFSWLTHRTCSQGYGKHHGKVSHLYPEFRLYKQFHNNIP